MHAGARSGGPGGPAARPARATTGWRSGPALLLAGLVLLGCARDGTDDDPTGPGDDSAAVDDSAPTDDSAPADGTTWDVATWDEAVWE
ncbi:MAG: hypothetical protein H6732_10825 [Alphaproteobacteria bacterium]|nr:hypothetical protein [Alphaproteobacteria bacterium]